MIVFSEIDCGQPDTISGAQYSGDDTYKGPTVYGSSFNVTCKDLYTLDGKSGAGDHVVRCLNDSNWDYGDIACTGKSKVWKKF